MLDSTSSKVLKVLNTIGPVPYFPALKEMLPNVTSAILVTYLEIQFPAPPDHPSFPVTVSVERVCNDLRVSRRTLALSLSAIARVYKEEAGRWRCARAYREFIQQHHRKKGTHKLYSIICDYNLERAYTFVLRRNVPLLRATFVKCGITATSLTAAAQNVSQDKTHKLNRSIELTKAAEAPSLVSSPRTLADLLLKSSVLAGDRRSVRYPRLRKAVAEGLESPDVLKVKQVSRKTQLRTKSNAVDPELPQEVVGRIMHLPD